MNQGFIYKITSPTGRVYIGQTINIKQRYDKYIRANCKGQRMLYNSIIKYGMDKHSFEVIFECPVELLDYAEYVHIKHFNSLVDGLNLREGGNTSKMTQDHKSKIATSNTSKKMPKDLLERLVQLHRTRVKIEEEIAKFGRHRIGTNHSEDSK